MAFSSLLFVTAFLPAFLLTYWATPRHGRNLTLLALSLLFYAWGAPRFLPVILFLGIVDFFLARAIAARRGTRTARLLVGGAVAMHLSVLAWFKYSNFFVGELGVGESLHWQHVVLPIGVSFLTFEEISYVVDTYRGDAQPARKLPQYLLFLMLFPHSIAGPIFRWKDLDAQLAARDEKLDDVVDGLARFAWGLAKKMLVADAAGVTADAAFAHNRGELNAGIAWLGAVAYAVQIYYDFSGYSDMAIGLGRMAGFRFKENFADPYVSASITEFWTRWHISLTTWLRDYLYIPLGGNRRGHARTQVNVLIVFVLSGFWHGAAWTFVLWGAYHGVLSLFERTSLGERWRTKTPRVIAVPITFALVCIGWVFFRATTAAQAFAFLEAMFGFATRPAIARVALAQLLPWRSAFFLALGLALVVVRAVGWMGPLSERRRLFVYAAPVLLLFSIIQIVNSKFVPLIYFKF